MDEPSTEFLEYRGRLISTAESSFATAINRLWAGNGGAIALLVTAAKGSTSLHSEAGPFVCYAVGLLLLALGEFYSLYRRLEELRTSEAADGFLELRTGNFTRPSTRIAREHVLAGLLSTAAFMCGTAWVVHLISAG